MVTKIKKNLTYFIKYTQLLQATNLNSMKGMDCNLYRAFYIHIKVGGFFKFINSTLD